MSLRIWIALLPFVAGCAVCEQLAATRVVAGTLLFIPELDDEQIPGLQGEAKSQLKVFFGDRPSESGEKPEPIQGASLRLIYPLAPDGLELVEETVLAADPLVPSDEKPSKPREGVYVLDLAKAGVELLPGEEYRVQVRHDGQVHEMAVTAPSGSTANLEVQKLTAEPHSVEQALQVKHPGRDRLAFAVVRWAPDPDRPSCERPRKLETFSDIPKSAEDALDLAENDARWRVDPITIPASAFPTCGIYTVVIAGMGRGTSTTGNLFIGSQLLAGRATGRILRVE